MCPSDPHASLAAATSLLVALSVLGARGIYQPPAPRAPTPQPARAVERPIGDPPSTVAPFTTAPRPGPEPRTTATGSTSTDATAAPQPTPGPTRTRAADGPVDAPAPFFTLQRPFEQPETVRASRYYPYGTTADGNYLLHHGVDIGNPAGTTVRAVADGRVIAAGPDDSVAWGPTTDFYGRLVVLRHDDVTLDSAPLYTLYGHLSQVDVRPDARVRAGQPIGKVGAAGIALGPHLHLEVRRSARHYGTTINPELLLRPLAGHGTIVGRVVGRAHQPLPLAEVQLFEIGQDGTEAWVARSTTYPTHAVNRTRFWDEGFVLADVPAGRYRVHAGLGAMRASSAPLTVTAGSAQRLTLTLPVPAATATEADTGTLNDS